MSRGRTSPVDSGQHESSLPQLTAVRPRANTGDGDAAVELRFENGSRLRYRATPDGVREEWFGTGDDRPVCSHDVSMPVEHGADGQANMRFEGRPPTRVLTDRALCTVSTYLSFENRTQAEFVWGDKNVAALLGER